ncbi:hypothetical protein [Pseudomonas arsenicoxydans]|uniref:hypothetical protein n=1 Tax=Pseudomonas arsenicoxydans TaxID=702115 RepID=UPI001375EDE0|nr:hypothetical protein [Pseudomonas arsenicoxydans]
MSCAHGQSSAEGVSAAFVGSSVMLGLALMCVAALLIARPDDLKGRGRPLMMFRTRC